MRTTALLAALAAGAAVLAAGGTARADEHYSGTTTLGPQFGLLRVGQVDDPAEDVLEHASIAGGDTYVYD
jgi:hypothetical protein